MPSVSRGRSIMNRRDKVYAVVLVGGKGKRLRPLSTDARPKAFLSVNRDGRTMFRATLDRIKKVVPAARIIVSAGKDHERFVQRDFPGIDKKNLLLEPVSRNTAPAIGAAAALVLRRHGDAVMVVLPADHYIRDETKFLSTVKEGVRFAARSLSLVVIGLEPAFASTQFGYIKVKAKVKSQKAKVRNVFPVEKFVEKPDAKTASRYMESGDYLWNSGVFIFRATAFLVALARYAPGLGELVGRCGGGRLAAWYRQCPDISIDYAVMQKADNIYCVKGSYRWQDIGSFSALREVLRRESRGFVERKGAIVKIV